MGGDLNNTRTSQTNPEPDPRATLLSTWSHNCNACFEGRENNVQYTPTIVLLLLLPPADPLLACVQCVSHQVSHAESEQALQRKLEEVCEELRVTQGSMQKATQESSGLSGRRLGKCRFFSFFFVCLHRVTFLLLSNLLRSIRTRAFLNNKTQCQSFPAPISCFESGPPLHSHDSG